MQLAQFLIFFQKSGSYVELRTCVINFRGENTAGGIRGIAKSRIQRLVTNYTLFLEISPIKKKHNYIHLQLELIKILKWLQDIIAQPIPVLDHFGAATVAISEIVRF